MPLKLKQINQSISHFFAFFIFFFFHISHLRPLISSTFNPPPQKANVVYDTIHKQPHFFPLKDFLHTRRNLSLSTIYPGYSDNYVMFYYPFFYGILFLFPPKKAIKLVTVITME